MLTDYCKGMFEKQEGCVLLMRCKWDLDELESISGHLNPKVSGSNRKDLRSSFIDERMLIETVKCTLLTIVFD